MAITYATREQVPAEFTWDLSGLFACDEDWMAEYEALKALPAEIAAFRGHLGDDAETLLRWFRLEDETMRRFGRLVGYAHCRSDQDTANPHYQDYIGKAVSAAVAVNAASAFAAPEIMAIDEDRLNLFYIAQPGLETYERSLYQIRRRAAHILSPAEEKLLASAGELARSPEKVRGMLADADLRYPDAVDAKGEKHPLTSGSYVPMLQSSDRALRESAFKNLYGVAEGFANTFAATLDGQFKSLRFFAAARGYETTLAASLDATEVPEAVYHGLIEAVHANLDKMYAYVALRKQLLGVEQLHMYDVYAPIVGEAEGVYPFEEAKRLVLEGLAVLGEDYAALLRESYANRWIDVYENTGKRSGAYCTGSSDPHPYVLLNHQDTLNSVFTLAHELGHAMHSYYSAKNQPACTSRYVIFVAEVASTVNEVLLMRHLLAHTDDRRQRAALINHFLDKFKATLFRQTMFAEFELWMGQTAEAGQTLTADVLREKYGELNALYFGPDMARDPEISLEWARIPHFFLNYYVFQYATGYSAAVAIAQRILHEGKNAVEDYKRFLSSGSSADPISLLKLAGVDMASGEAVDSALALFGELVEELRSLTAEN